MIAAVIAALLWQTRWPSLRLGLVILLAGQLGTAVALVFRNRHIAGQWQHDPLGWFDGEAEFLDRLALFESVARMAGFLVLGYGLWVVTRSLLIAVLLGAVYPLSIYFGMTRKNLQRAKAALRTQRENLESTLD